MSQSLSTTRGHIIEKIITARNGARVRVAFLVSETAGYRKITVLSVQPANELTLAAPRSASLLLSTHTCASEALDLTARTTPAYTASIPTYSELLFFISQPTRAPSRGY